MSLPMRYDKVIFGAGLYGLYAARRCGERGERVLVLEWDGGAFRRASYVNQARVHMGYHYPRSLSTALKSAGYFKRFVDDFGYCILSEFDQVYATSRTFSWTNAKEFARFCGSAGIRCDEVSPEKFFNPGMCDGAFLTTEYTYDAFILRDHLLDDLCKLPSVDLVFATQPESMEQDGSVWNVRCSNGFCYEAPFVLNATYAGVNNIHALVGAEPFRVKYELCEIILCDVNEKLRPLGLTVMDGPFFSIMPFGKTGMHSLTSVTFTPHQTSHDIQPTFDCQKQVGAFCRPGSLANCDECIAKPESAWPLMSQLARKYMRPEYGFAHKGSLFSMKPILSASEVDDSRPTVVRRIREKPTFISVLSGKINTVYDLDQYLDEENHGR